MALGGPSRGRLHIAAGSDGELRSGGLDVGLAGTILVVGSRIDAETLTRARAMGVRGIVVGVFQENCWIVGSRGSGEAICIDPGLGFSKRSEHSLRTG